MERLVKQDWEALPDLGKLGSRAAPAIPHLLMLMGWKKSVLMKDRGSLTLYSVNHGPFRKPLTEHFLPREAALVLAGMGEASLRALFLVLGDRNPLRRYWALAALGWNRAAKKRKDVPARVAVLLNDPDQGVKCQAVQVLGFLGARAYKERIARFLLDPDMSIRNRSIEALKRLVRGPELDPLPLLKALESRTDWKIKAARGALKRLKGRFRAETDVDRGLAEEERRRPSSKCSPREKVNRLRKLVREGDASAPRAVLPALRNPSPLVRAAAVSLLEKIDVPGREKHLERALRDPDRSVRMAAAGCLGRIGGVRALPRLFRAYADGRIGERILDLVRSLNRKDPGRIRWELTRRTRGGPAKDRQAAAYLLGFVTDPGSREVLAKTARWDRDRGVRKTALESLVRLGKREALPMLVQALRDRDISIRKFALGRLRWITRKRWGLDPGPWEAWLRTR